MMFTLSIFKDTRALSHTTHRLNNRYERMKVKKRDGLAKEAD